jgi:8-oxo-dGTP pyrophosphatase MutT (NUDIX family)
VFTERSAGLSRHSGQISCPGGSREPEDATLVDTALRETEEELGVPATEVHVLGQLPEVHVQVSNFLITPVVGFLPYQPHFVPDPREVATVLEVPLAHLQDPATLREEEWEVRGGRRNVAFYQFDRFQIWGATGRVIELFLASEFPNRLTELLLASAEPDRRS